MVAVLSAPRVAMSVIDPGLGTWQIANQPVSRVVANRRGVRRFMPPAPNESSSHSAITVTPDAGARSVALRTMPMTTAPEFCGVGAPQIAVRNRAADGVAKSARTDPPSATVIVRSSGSRPSESSTA